MPEPKLAVGKLIQSQGKSLHCADFRKKTLLETALGGKALAPMFVLELLDVSGYETPYYGDDYDSIKSNAQTLTRERFSAPGHDS